MAAEDLIQRSYDIITAYYDNDLEPFFHSISDNVLWIGPRGGQMLRGKDAVISAWTAASNHSLHFSMENIQIQTAAADRQNREVLLDYHVYTHFPDGQTDQHHQRLHLSWSRHIKSVGEKRKAVWQIFMIHISNIVAEEQLPDRVYADSPSNSHQDSVNKNASRIFFRAVAGKGESEVTYYLDPAAVVWISSADKGHHCILHTLNGEYKSIENTHYFEDNFPDDFMRVHMEYLFNPMYLLSVERFKITLTDGTELPIPEKKYPAFRDRLKELSLFKKKKKRK